MKRARSRIGFARYKNLGCRYVAVVTEVDVEAEPRVTQAWAAVDVGLVAEINPDGVINQIEGGIIQAASMTLKEQVTFDREKHHVAHLERLSSDEVPAEAPQLEVTLINRPRFAACRRGGRRDRPHCRRHRQCGCNDTGVRVSATCR